ncbi:eukaryotic translation initiation factor 2-alpha kinase 3-like [Ylistrum balloti]|uniref:eukaryotic translation initiation factor 2-alpha kinase 3-like n=1 Tax=Ylistrum balloti TaxID=509963 RepID=UPI002905F4B5|nr:eukaryotic translation initiation factor 2-alpha kinase 3-like [Ylistrum balloti]
MGRRRNKRLTTLLTWFVTSVGALCYTFSCIGATNADTVLDEFADKNNAFTTSHYGHDPDSSEQTAACHSKLHKESHLMIVSTLNGDVSAIDINNKGKLEWRISADSSPLLSSSISKLEISRNGMPTRLIPSLDGGLYQYDGESIEAIPMTVETLLSSSNKLSDKMMMVGSKDIRTYGVNPADGQMNYVCSAEGCQFVAESDVTEMDDILVITRNTQTVRAVDCRTGGEKWNFSVGQHELQFLGGKSVPPSQTVKDNSDDDISILTCGSDDDEEEDLDFNIQDTLRIVVPEGLIVGMDPSDSSLVEWQHKFTSPVAGAWFLHKKELMPVNVFDKRLVPALSSFHPPTEELPMEPLLYVGLHHNQLYVQPSTTMKEHVSQAVSKGEVSRLDVPRVTWKPYLNSAPSRTPWLNYKGHGEVPLLDHCEKNLPEMEDEQERGLSVWHENYPFDNGYYLYPEFEFVVPNSSYKKNNSTSQNSSSSIIESVMTTSLWTYWRQVISISVVTSILVNIILHKLGRRRNIPLLPQMSDSGNVTVAVDQDSAVIQKITEEYTSRYRQDFEQIQVLGRGGYGVVFEARNKMDTCCYAVKRIELKSSAKEKVMREVRALATLEHTGIVRFFHAWEESPPPGWQEDMDRQWVDSECVTLPTPCNSVETESHALSIPDTPVFDLKNPFGGQSRNFDYNFSKKKGSSAEFSVDQSWISSDTEPSRNQPFFNISDDLDNEDSFEVEFKLEDSEDSGSCSKSLPFTRHHKDCWKSDSNSFSVQFEDSGCAENEKSSKSESSGGIVFTGETSDQNSNNFRLNMPLSSCSSQLSASTDIQLSKTKESHKNPKDETKQLKEPSQKLFLYIQMQLCQRETLKEWLSANNKPRNKNDMLKIFGQIVCAIEYVHGCGLMHRDLKPSNIFFSADNVIKIGDFGLVTALSEEEILGEENLGNVTFKHTTEVGTKLYMGPELVCGKTYGQKVDIFSLGMILFELLYPFSTQMERVRTMTAVKIRQLPREFDMAYPEQSKYIRWLLCEDPCGRPTATEILKSSMMKGYCCSPPPARPRLRTISNDSSGSSGSVGHVRNLSM